MGQESQCRNPVCDRRLDDLERRVTDLEDDGFKADLWKVIGEIKVSVANLNGRMAGYLLAGGILGAAVAVLAQVVMKRAN